MDTAEQLLPRARPAYRTALGGCYAGDSMALLAMVPDGSIDLVMTSPPFALERKKAYGNEKKADYVAWLVEFGRLVHRKLAPTGSFVVDIGGSYEPGRPVRSLYPFRTLIALCDEAGFLLGQDFYWHNPAMLPSPIEYCNKRKIRAKGSVDNLWWLVKSPDAKAKISRVLAPYSKSMLKLLADPAGQRPRLRPSGHDISAKFGARDNGGAIPSNLLQISNTDSNGAYLRACKSAGVKPHPARFPAGLPEFFIRFLTDPGDLVVDIFAGSNTTGRVAETEGRRWLAFERDPGYVAASAFRFAPSGSTPASLSKAHARISGGRCIDFTAGTGP